MRAVKITRNYIPHAEGSVLIELGRTRVICAVTYEESVPRFLAGSRQGWVTAEYSMLPRATTVRNKRESVTGRQRGRTMEIQRLIGRSLRAVTDMSVFPDKTFLVDCDVIEADGGTRTAAITGAYVALVDAFDNMIDDGAVSESPVSGNVAAISVGLRRGFPRRRGHEPGGKRPWRDHRDPGNIGAQATCARGPGHHGRARSRRDKRADRLSERCALGGVVAPSDGRGDRF
jgi:ribonuclease PH